MSVYNAYGMRVGKKWTELRENRNDFLEIEKSRNKKKGYKKYLIKTRQLKSATCSQCKRGMDRHIAKLQKENKRENAPICMACIAGIPRRPLDENGKPIYKEKKYGSLDDRKVWGLK